MTWPRRNEGKGHSRRKLPETNTHPTASCDMDAQFETSDVFRSIRYNRNTQLENQKMALNLLDATEGTLREQGLALEPSNYFLALWPLLDDEDREDQARMTKTAASDFNVAVAYLLGFVFPHLPGPFIAEHYSTIYSKVGPALQRFLTVSPFVRALLAIIGALLGAFSQEQWQDRPSLDELLLLVLHLLIDPRPKVRKLAQDTIERLFSTENALTRERILEFTCRAILEGATRRDSSDALHTVSFIGRSLARRFQAADVELFLGPLQHCATLGNTHLTVATLKLLATLCDVLIDKGISLGEKVSRTLGELVFSKLKPEVTLNEVVPPWLGLATKAMRVSPGAECNRFSIIISFFLSPEDAILQATEEALRNSYGIIHDGHLAQEVFQLLKKALTIKTGVSYVINSIADCCREIQISAAEAFSREILLALDDLHRANNKLASPVEKAISAFLMRFGPETVIEVLPLNLSASTANPRAWMLPLLRDSVSHARLAYFSEFLLPMSEQFLSRAAAHHRASGQETDAKACELLSQQIWATLPAFMTFPTDFATAFPALAPILGRQLMASPDLRSIIVASLTAFIQRARSFADELSGALLESGENYPTAAQDLAVLASTAPNFLPILFNIYGATTAERRGCLLNCIDSFLSCVDATLVETQYFNRVLSSLEQAKGAELISFLEVASVLIKGLSVECHQKLLSQVLPLVNSRQNKKDHGQLTILKRAYRIVGDILGREDLPLTDELLAVLESVLSASYETGQTSAIKKMRFWALLKLFNRLPESHLYWIPLFLPEMVLGIKDTNHQARLYAFELLLVAARRMLNAGGVINLANGAQASLDEFMTMLLAGLAAKTPYMISATIMALARIIFEFRETLDSSLVANLLRDVIMTLASPSREVVKSALGFIKVILSVISSNAKGSHEDEIMQPQLGELIGGLLQWSNEHHQGFKVRVRHLMERLIRRYGLENVWQLTPPQHHKLLTNIRKRRERLKRRKVSDAQGDERDDDVGHHFEQDETDKLTRVALTGATALTRMTNSEGASYRKASNRFEAALNDSASDLDDGDVDMSDDAQWELPADSILHDIEDVDDEAELETILSKKLALATGLGKRQTKTKSAGKERLHTGDDDRDEDDDDIELKLDQTGRLVIPDHDDSLESDNEADADEESASKKKRARVMTSVAPFAKRGASKGDAKRRTDKYEPYSYLPMTRTDKASASVTFRGGKKKVPKYYMKRA